MMDFLKLAFVFSCFILCIENVSAQRAPQMAGRSYRIRNKGTGRYMGVENLSTAAGGAGEIYLDAPQTNENRSNQIWRVISKDNGYFIVNNRSGLYLTESRWAQQNPLSDANQPSMIWKIHPDHDGYFTIQSKKTLLFITVEGYGGLGGVTWINYLFLTNLVIGAGRQYQQWVFEVEKEQEVVPKDDAPVWDPLQILNPKTSFSEEAIIAGRSFRIRNRNSGLYMGTVGYNTAAAARIDQNVQQTDENEAGQIWVVFPLEQNHYHIMNNRSRMLLNIASDVRGKDGQIEQQPLYDHPDPFNIWNIQPDRDGYYTIQNIASHFYLSIQSYSKNPGAAVITWDLQDDGNRTSQQWILEVVYEYSTVIEVQDKVIHDVNDIGDIRQLSTRLPPKSHNTDEILIGQVVIPFHFIKDPILSIEQQLKISPYYIMQRYGYWQMVYYYEHKGVSQITRTSNIPVGKLTKTPQDAQLTDISLNLDLSFQVNGLKVEFMMAEINRGLKIGDVKTIFDEGLKMSNMTIQFEQKYPSGSHQSEAIWFRMDRFTLKRTNGKVIMNAIFRSPSVSISDSLRGQQAVIPSSAIIP